MNSGKVLAILHTTYEIAARFRACVQNENFIAVSARKRETRSTFYRILISLCEIKSVGEQKSFRLRDFVR